MNLFTGRLFEHLLRRPDLSLDTTLAELGDGGPVWQEAAERLRSCGLVPGFG